MPRVKDFTDESTNPDGTEYIGIDGSANDVQKLLISVLFNAYGIVKDLTPQLGGVLDAQNNQIHFGESTLTDGANISWDLDSNPAAKVTLTANRTLDNPTNMNDGATYILRVIQDAGGTNTLAYGAAYLWPSGTAPILSTGGNAIDLLTFYSDGTNMYGNILKDFS